MGFGLTKYLDCYEERIRKMGFDRTKDLKLYDHMKYKGKNKKNYGFQILNLNLMLNRYCKMSSTLFSTSSLKNSTLQILINLECEKSMMRMT